MTCPRCGTETNDWPCPNCGFPVLRRYAIKGEKKRAVVCKSNPAIKMKTK